MALLGANGAGKTTTLRAISGIVRPSAGSIHFMGKRIDWLPPEQNRGNGNRAGPRRPTGLP